MKKIVTFGQIMMRLSPPGFTRFVQAHQFDITYAGGEANVGIATAQWGVEAVHVTRFPDNDMGRAAIMYLRKYGLNTSEIHLGGDRLPVYFVENGANARASQVIYDRMNDSFCTLDEREFDWERILKGADWFHFTGITPALSKSAAHACQQAVQTARQLGVKVSADVNYMHHIVDRIGSGDAFIAGFLFGYDYFKRDVQRTLDFATASAALKHTVEGDFNLVSIEEIQRLATGDTSGKLSR